MFISKKKYEKQLDRLRDLEKRSILLEHVERHICMTCQGTSFGCGLPINDKCIKEYLKGNMKIEKTSQLCHAKIYGRKLLNSNSYIKGRV